LGGLADEGINLDIRLRPSVVTEQVIKQIYESDLKPNYSLLDPRLQSACKLSLQYVLKASDFNYRNEFNSMLLPFACPDEPRQAFLWLWEVLFPNEQPLPLSQPFEVDGRANVARHILQGY
jgi:hypothetical protein